MKIKRIKLNSQKIVLGIRFLRRNRIPSAALAALLIFALAGSYFLFFKSTAVEAGWWNDSWQYRKAINITNDSGAELVDFQTLVLSAVNLSADITAGKIRADLGDLRFVNYLGEVLPYWIEDITATTTVNAWVKAPSLPAGGATIYMYYGNPSATSAQNPSNIFPFFDDFNSSLDTAKWTATGAYSISGGAMTITTGAVYTNSQILATAQNYIYEYKAKWAATGSGYAGLEIAGAQTTYGSNSPANKLAYFMTNGGALDNQAWAGDGTVTSYNIVSGVTQYTVTANTYYIDGFSVDASNIRYYHNRSQTNPYAGTWTSAPYLWLGYFTGAGAGTTDTRDLTVDWVLARKYASTAPTAAAPATEEVAAGPVAYWSLDDGQGITAQDGTTNKNNGTLTNMSATASSTSGWQTEDNCIAGKCSAFDGGNDYVDIGNSNILKPSLPITVSVWVKLKVNNVYQGILMNDDYYSDSSGNYYGIEVDISNSGKLRASFGDGAGNSLSNRRTKTGTTALLTNIWYHLTFVIRGANDMSLYINGVDDGGTYEGSGGVLAYSSASGRIGEMDSNFHINGKIDEVKVYPYSRTAAQIKMDYNVGLAGMSGASAGDGAAVSIGKKSSAWLSNGLVAWWKMDETATTSGAIDYSGNGNTGTYINTASTTAGYFGNGGSFDGVDDYVSIPDNGTILDFNATSQYTWSSWIKNASTTSGTSCFLSKDGIPVSKIVGFNLCLNQTDSTADVVVCKGNGAWELNCSSGLGLNIAVNEWNNIAITYDGATNWGIYKNGSLMGTINFAVDSDTSYKYFIGAGVDTTNTGVQTPEHFFKGSVDDVRVYNRLLSNREVSDLYNYAPGPIAYWKMDERNGQYAYDNSGNGNNATLGASAVSGSDDPAWANGKFGAGLKFDGVDDRVSVEDSDSTDIGFSNLTISFWMKNNNVSSLQRIIAKLATNASGAGYFVSTVGAGNQLYFQAQDGVNSLNPVFNPYLKIDNLWHYVSVTLDRSISSGVKFYFDGVSQTCNSNCSYNATLLGNISNSLKLALGNRSATDPGLPMNGSLDDVKIYNYARTQKQIIEDMNAGHPAGGSPVGSQTVYYKFDEGYGATANNSGNGGATLNGTLTPGGGGANDTAAKMWDNAGKFGKGVELDGTDDYISVPNFTY
ncbi:MAG: DUF2341 domain-containing protein [Patescibacteria group bacterium]|jgi:hypothetical protein